MIETDEMGSHSKSFDDRSCSCVCGQSLGYLESENIDGFHSFYLRKTEFDELQVEGDSMGVKKYSTGYFCSGCEHTYRKHKGKIFEDREKFFCNNCIIEGENLK